MHIYTPTPRPPVLVVAMTAREGSRGMCMVVSTLVVFVLLSKPVVGLYNLFRGLLRLTLKIYT